MEASCRNGAKFASSRPRRCAPHRASGSLSSTLNSTEGAPEIKRSAGVLLYRTQAGGDPQLLIVHMGGPFWKNKEAAAWSIPKGGSRTATRPLRWRDGSSRKSRRLAAATRRAGRSWGDHPGGRQADHRIRRRGGLRRRRRPQQHVRDRMAAPLRQAAGLPRDRPGGVGDPRRGADQARQGAGGAGRPAARAAGDRPLQPAPRSPARRRRSSSPVWSCYHATGCTMSTEIPHTIADIARLAGVSKSTVSRALNDSPLIGDETKKRIQAIADEHRFQINVPARRLSLKQSDTSLSSHTSTKKDLRPRRVHARDHERHLERAPCEGYDMLIVQVDPHDSNWARGYLETGRVDGFILLSATCSRIRSDTRRDERPVRPLGSHAPDHAYCSVTGDNVAGGKIATEHLLGRGRRRVAFLGGPAKAFEVQDRYPGLRGCAAGSRGRPSTRHSWSTGTTRTPRRRQRCVSGSSKPRTSTPSSSTATGWRSRRWTRSRARPPVPDDIAVIGYDDISIAQQATHL